MSPLDGGVVVYDDLMEDALDRMFVDLEEGTSPLAPLRVLASEQPCSPLLSRQIMLELLFEKYGAAEYGHVVGALAALRHVMGSKTAYAAYSGEVLCLSYSAATSLALDSGVPIFQRATRSVHAGTAALAAHMREILLAKYPELEPLITPYQVMKIFAEHARVAECYESEVTLAVANHGISTESMSMSKIVNLSTDVAKTNYYYSLVTTSASSAAEARANEALLSGAMIAGYTYEPPLPGASSAVSPAATTLSPVVELTNEETCAIADDRKAFISGLVAELVELRILREISELEGAEKIKKASLRKFTQAANEVRRAEDGEITDDDGSLCISLLFFAH